MANLTIRQVIDQITRGQIRIPAFQRGFVWDESLVAHLMDSIYKEYPFGAVILWRTKKQLRTERDLGNFELPELDPDYPIDYVLDGQQRLTAIFGVFQNTVSPSSPTEWNKIYFDMKADESQQDSYFFAIKDEDADPRRYFPIGVFFDSVRYRVATARLEDDEVALIDKIQERFKEATIPVQSISTDDRAKVAIVFERVNRLGVDLDVFQLLSAWTWSEDFDLQTKFNDLAEELEPFGFGEVGEDTNLLLRCSAGVVAGNPSPEAVIGLNGAIVRQRFDEIENGIRGAIDFIQNNLGVEKLKNLPYPTLLVPLAAFFAVKGSEEFAISDTQRRTLLRWFWRSCFSRRFSAGVFTNLRRDLNEVIKLRGKGNSDLADITSPVEPEFFSDTRFTISSVNTKTFILMLSQLGPRSFISGSEVSLKDVLKDYNRNEFHHLYPQKFLKNSGEGAESINRLANFAFMSRADNRKLGGDAPSIYKTSMPSGIDEILRCSAVPYSLFSDDYNMFIRDRSELLTGVAREFRDNGSLCI